MIIGKRDKSSTWETGRPHIPFKHKKMRRKKKLLVAKKWDDDIYIIYIYRERERAREIMYIIHSPKKWQRKKQTNKQTNKTISQLDKRTLFLPLFVYNSPSLLSLLVFITKPWGEKNLQKKHPWFLIHKTGISLAETMKRIRNLWAEKCSEVLFNGFWMSES